MFPHPTSRKIARLQAFSRKLLLMRLTPAWELRWRHIGLGSAPRPLGLGANWQLIPPTGGSSGFRGWYRHIVDVAFAQGGAGEARLGLEFWPDIAHGGAQAPGELVHDRLDRPTVGHLALDALGNQLHLVFD